MDHPVVARYLPDDDDRLHSSGSFNCSDDDDEAAAAVGIMTTTTNLAAVPSKGSIRYNKYSTISATTYIGYHGTKPN